MNSTRDDDAVSADTPTALGTATVMSSGSLTLNRVRGDDVAVHLKR